MLRLLKGVRRAVLTGVWRLGGLLEQQWLAGRADLEGPIPPLHLRKHYYRTGSVAAFRRVCEGARAELVTRGLRPEHRVLDVGSGIGNLALSLTHYLDGPGRYEGVDINREAVGWCNRAIGARYSRFHFRHADVASAAYNASGGEPASAYRFPFEDRSFDCVFAGSVFTHLLPDAAERYVAEIARVLAPGGFCVASYFLIDEQTRPRLDAGRSFIPFDVEHPSGVCRLNDRRVPEAAVAFEESYVVGIHAKAGLEVRDVRRGQWSSGIAHDQDVLTAVPAGVTALS